MVKNNCKNCWNRVGEEHCTRMLDMEDARFKQCEGWKKVEPKKVKPKKTKKEITYMLSQREQRILSKFDVGSNFERYKNKGGHYSFRTGKHVIK